MDLFDTADSPHNLLPFDGEVHYYAPIVSTALADEYYQSLLQEIEWRHDEAQIYGKKITTKRKVAWYADQPFSYTYSRTTKIALPWSAQLLVLKKRVEEVSGERYNACLLNLYHSGAEGMAWHSDAEIELQKHSAIASLSFGATRTFSFRHKVTQHKTSVLLEHGSLLVMRGTTQQYWQHRLPETRKVSTARVNLTFRQMKPQPL